MYWTDTISRRTSLSALCRMRKSAAPEEPVSFAQISQLPAALVPAVELRSFITFRRAPLLSRSLFLCPRLLREAEPLTRASDDNRAGGSILKHKEYDSNPLFFPRSKPFMTGRAPSPSMTHKGKRDKRDYVNSPITVKSPQNK